MNNASTRVDTRARPWGERLQPWIAALVSALLHLLMLLLLLASTPTVTSPQGAAGGSRMRVDLLGETPQAEQPQPAPAPRQVKKRRASPPVRSTLVKHADHPLPPDETAPPDDAAARRPTPAEQPPSQTQTAATAPPTSLQRYRQRWTGRPPGMQDQDVADQDTGTGRNALPSQGNGRNPNASGPSLEVGGYMVYYDLHSETQLRAWKEQGMKEIFLPLPGTRYFMICPVEIALKRGAGECRLLPPDSPELQSIGDAREVINMIQVYHHGDVVWRGPGAYR